MNRLFYFTALLALTWLAAACSKSAASLESKNAALFAKADAKTKELWQAAAAAIKTNGYAAATLKLKTLQVLGTLTPDQLRAVNETVNAVSDQMYDAANKGDAAALREIEELRKAMAR